jgi:hypothetical protein
VIQSSGGERQKLIDNVNVSSRKNGWWGPITIAGINLIIILEIAGTTYNEKFGLKNFDRSD